MPAAVPSAGTGNRALGILLDDPGTGRPVHVEHIPARSGREVPWPSWVPEPVAEAFAARGVHAPWCHQALAADHAQAGLGSQSCGPGPLPQYLLEPRETTFTMRLQPFAWDSVSPMTLSRQRLER